MSTKVFDYTCFTISFILVLLLLDDCIHDYMHMNKYEIFKIRILESDIDAQLCLNSYSDCVEECENENKSHVCDYKRCIPAIQKWCSCRVFHQLELRGIFEKDMHPDCFFS